MNIPKDVMCPKCGEHRLLDVIQDPMGERIFCKVCAFVFLAGFRTSQEKSENSKTL